MLSLLKAAVRVAQPPTLFGYRSGEGWTGTDRLLVLAHQLYTESLCKCGFPVWMGHAEEHAGEDLFHREYAHCLICEQVDQADREADSVTPGDLLRVENDLYKLHAPSWMRKLLNKGS